MIVQGAGNVHGTAYLVGEAVPPVYVPVDQKAFDYAIELIGLTVDVSRSEDRLYSPPLFPGAKKIPIIKMVRERFVLGLKEAKDATEAALSHLSNQGRLTL